MGRVAADQSHSAATLESAWTLHQAGQFAAAEQLYRSVLQESDDPNAWCFLGMVCHDTHRFDEALDAYRHAIALKPAFPVALNNQANTLHSLERFSESIASFQAALAIEPAYASAQFNLSLLFLQRGNWEEGFAGYEARWRYLDLKEPTFPQPRWDGSAPDGRRILLHAEQGLGDTLHFVRFARNVKARGGKVVVSAPAALLPILGRCADIDELVAQGQPLPPFDLHAPLMSLPHILGLPRADTPAERPYLSADPALVDVWRQELAGLRGVKVGLAWQGSPTNRNSATLEQFVQLARLPGIQFVSLQKGLGAEQVALQCDRIDVLDFGDRLDANGSFLDTAAIMMNLDLVITVDTSIGHLAGALGVPVWIALGYSPDWRWMLGRSDTPWYPSARLFRQPRPGDWDGVFRQLAEALVSRGLARHQAAE
jgi:tetratricopeptide (TPR) repeat protein